MHEDEIAGILDAREPRRLVALVGGQPRPRGGRVGEPAPDEHLREHMPDPELALEREHRADVTRIDAEARRHGRHARKLRAAMDGTRRCELDRYGRSPYVCTEPDRPWESPRHNDSKRA